MNILLFHDPIQETEHKEKQQSREQYEAAIHQEEVALVFKAFQRLESVPASLLPTAVLRKKPPIMRAVIRGGLSLLTSDRPIGERQSSPTVMTA
jgi:hypothetical protein